MCTLSFRLVMKYVSPVCLLMPVACPWAAEGGSTEYLGGFTGFAAGYIPPVSGVYFADDVYYYHGSTSALAVNGRVALNVSTDVLFDVAEASWVTPWKLLGGNYGVGFALPVGYVNVDVGIDQIGKSHSVSTGGFGDSILLPALLGWHSGNWHSSAALSVFCPTGRYDRNQPLNLSKNFWAIDAAYSLSYLTPTGLDLSGSAGYTVNFENPTTHYKSGDVLHLDLTFGQNLSKEFKVGIAGYAVVQVTGDSGSGATLGSFESDIYALGPAANYNTKLGDTDISLQLRWYHEFGAKNHLKGDGVYLTAALKL
jgi:hypothetical protein